jgi:hypothetical protein
VFLKNTKSLTNKTQVRAVFRKRPELIKKLTADILVDFKLTGKEVVLLISSIMKDHEKKFDGWEFDPEFAETLKLDVMAEMLNGKSKLSKRFQSAMKGVFEKKPEEEEILEEV